MVAILDIGAGSLCFAKDLRRNNKQLPLLVFCGEPYWSNSRLKKVISADTARELIEEERTGIYRVISSYRDFAFDEHSLDMVTVNSPHPLTPANGIEEEIERCIRPGGIFFFGHSTTIDIEPSSEFTLLHQSSYPHATWKNWWHDFSFDLAEIEGYPKDIPSRLIPSPIIRSNMIEAQRRRDDTNYRNKRGIMYMYNQIRLHPNYKVWQKSF